ncbi:hypothetical protein SprV_0301077300 [Sparganum proliferum]
MASSTNLLKSKAKRFELSPAAHAAFEAAKKALADAILLHHLSSDAHAQLILTTDAFNCAVGSVLHRQVNNQLRPLAPFSQKLPPAQTRYSTEIRNVRDSDSVVDGAWARPEINSLTSIFDLTKLSGRQPTDKSIDDLRTTTTLQLRDVPFPASPCTI